VSHFLWVLGSLLSILCPATKLEAQNTARQNGRDTSRTDSLRFPIRDRRGDPFSDNRNKNPFDLKDTGYLKRNIEYDPVTKQYYIVEKIGESYYRKPSSLNFEEFQRLRSREMETENFRNRADANFTLNRKLVRPKLRMFDDLLWRAIRGKM
jgi:hypothetical protein